MDREKQIEEIAKVLCTACHDDGYACDYDTDTDSCRFSYPEFSIFDGLESWEE